ncbi:hypothetical protein GWN42_11765 [candidate division KSB1 bacterium]|nr:hypothetical protein [candidate division KSB1 bacterium]
MERFLQVFSRYLCFSYSCFDRIVIHGYLRCFFQPATVVYLFKEILGFEAITKDVLRQKADAYNKWVEQFASEHKITCEWAEKDVRKQDALKSRLTTMKRSHKFGVYVILKSMEQGATFRSCRPKYKPKDPNYHLIKKTRSRFTHYYFYILDPTLGPMLIRVASFFPFHTTYYLNGHSIIERKLLKENIAFKKKDNAFLAISDPQRLQTIADSLTPEIISERLASWSNFLVPTFSDAENKALNLKRFYSIAQIEYCRNFIFNRNFPIRKLFERACELGLLTMTKDKIAFVFGHRITKRLKGKLHTVLDKADHGHHVFRAYFKHAFVKQYEKYSTFLRNEVVSNNLKDFNLKKGLGNLLDIKLKFQQITDRFASFQAQTFNNHFQFDILSKLAKPVTVGKTKVAGIKLHNERLIRLMEALLHSGSSISIWKTKELYDYILQHFRLQEHEYSLSQLRYDVRKLKAHAVVERIGKSYSYRLTEYGRKVCLSMVLFHKKLYGPIANSLFNRKPAAILNLNSKLEKAYFRIDKEIDKFINLLAA